MISGMTWLVVEGGEYNEQFTQLSTKEGAVKLVIFSDRDGERWSVHFDGEEEPHDLNATDVVRARSEALRWALDI